MADILYVGLLSGTAAAVTLMITAIVAVVLSGGYCPDEEEDY